MAFRKPNWSPTSQITPWKWGEKSVPLFRQGGDEHGGTRTPDTQNRNLMLYPTELHAQSQALA
jgi:hypothetical protein